MNILDLLNANTTLLTEANILNVKDPHDGHSIQKYLKHYAKSIGSDVAKKMFIKKIQKLLLNDPKYHFAVRELPDDAPDWAKQALADRDLFYFKSDPTLDNAIEHITHYIAKMEEDMGGTDANKKAVATKEFAGFAKAENLEMLSTKSNEYFERGKDASVEFEGTKVIYKTGQFTWMKLETATAFKNAGNTLNNCIGSHWTKANTDSNGMSIIVLADNKNTLIVAARIKNKENELQEMKGKNNRPPIDAYMSPVAAMINKFKLSLSSGAHNDVIAAGYYFDEDTRKLLTKPQAIKKLVAVDVIGDIAFGLKLVQPKPSADNDAARIIFSELYSGSSWTYRHGMGGVEIFEGRLENGNPVISATLENKKLKKLQTFFNDRLHDESHLQEALEVSKKHEYVKAFVTELIQRDKINRIDSDILRHIFWELNLEWDEDNKRLVDRAEGEEKHLNKKDHKWKKFVDKSTINTMARQFDDELDKIAPPIKAVYLATEEIADDRSRNEHDMHLAIVVDKNKVGHLANISGKGLSQDHVGFKKEANHTGYGVSFKRVAPDPKSIRSIIALAKEEGFTLQTPALARFGVTGEKPEHYKQHETEWKKIPGDPEGVMADFSHLRDEDRFTAVYYTAMSELGGSKSKDAFEINDKLAKTSSHGGGYISNKDNINTADQFKGHTPKTANKALGNVDAIYKVSVGYGTASTKHGAMLLVSKKKIIKLDTETEKHKWQGWNDFDEVAEILNKFASEHDLVFNKNAVTEDKRARSEFRVDNGKLTTMTKVKSAELSRKKKKEGVDSLEYADGWTLHRMTPDEQGKWIRRGIQDGVRGQAWLLKDDDDKKRAIFTILHQRVARMFFHDQGQGSDDWPTSYGSKVHQFLPYLKTAQKEFKWRDSKSGTMKVTNVPDSTIDNLRQLKNMRDPENPHYIPGSLWQMKNLRRDGLVDQLTARKFKINTKGKAALAKYDELKQANRSASVTDMDLAVGADPHADFSIPDPRARAPRPAPAAGGAARPVRAGAGGGATKSTQALTKFTAHVDEHGRIPTRGEFIAYMEEDPFNMSKAGAQTYYYTTKKKYANLNEAVLGNLSQLLLVEPDASFSSFADLVFDSGPIEYKPTCGIIN